jgi:cation diffusion facilitator family transporter
MQSNRYKQSIFVINLGLFANIFLAILKSIFGIIGHSPALLADGINSTSDVVYFIVVKIFMTLADKPADEDHPYGHRQLESISSLVVGAFILTTAVAIFWDSLNQVFELLSGHGDFQGASNYALLVALFTIFLKIILAITSFKVAKKTSNNAILAIAYDHRNDIFSALAASIGIFLGQMGYLWIDPLAGALVALIILKTGIKVLQDSADELMKTAPDKKLLEQIKKIVLEIKGVKGIEEVHAHRYGHFMMINLTICVNGNLTVNEGDQIANNVEEELYKKIDFLRKVNIHYHQKK